jgi:ribosomal protein L11 methyltransferase
MPPDAIPKTASPLPPEVIRRRVLETVQASPRKLTPAAVEAAVAGRLGIGRRPVRSAVRDLIAARELCYTYVFGASFLEPCFNRPVRLSPRVVVKPPECRFTPQPGDIVIDLSAGAAFGGGEHPSTRLALQAMDVFFSSAGSADALEPDAAALDVGTGSGILVVAAMGFGVPSGLGIDIDPCARAEARENVRLNRLQDRVVISDRDLETLTDRFSLISANLRSPTLARMADRLTGLLTARGCLILSGVRVEEMPWMVSVYEAKGAACGWRGEENGWGAMAFEAESFGV